MGQVSRPMVSVTSVSIPAESPSRPASFSSRGFAALASLSVSVVLIRLTRRRPLERGLPTSWRVQFTVPVTVERASMQRPRHLEIQFPSPSLRSRAARRPWTECGHTVRRRSGPNEDGRRRLTRGSGTGLWRTAPKEGMRSASEQDVNRHASVRFTCCRVPPISIVPVAVVAALDACAAPCQE